MWIYDNIMYLYISAKQKLDMAKKTGGGPAETLNQAEDLLLHHIGGRAATSGLECAVDTDGDLVEYVYLFLLLNTNLQKKNNYLILSVYSFIYFQLDSIKIICNTLFQ